MWLAYIEYHQMNDYTRRHTHTHVECLKVTLCLSHLNVRIPASRRSTISVHPILWITFGVLLNIYFYHFSLIFFSRIESYRTFRRTYIRIWCEPLLVCSAVECANVWFRCHTTDVSHIYEYEGNGHSSFYSKNADLWEAIWIIRWRQHRTSVFA